MNRQAKVIPLLIVGLLGFGPEVAMAERPRDATPPRAVPMAMIQRWVAELDSDQFAVRESAMNRLISTGSGAIDPVVSAMTGDRREMIARGVYVLEKLAQNGDSATQEAARAALERLAAETTTLAARRAGASLEALDLIRQRRAMKALSWLGARIQFLTGPVRGQLRQRPYSIQIDERWSGTDEHLIHLGSLVDIQRVVFQGPQVGDAWL